MYLVQSISQVINYRINIIDRIIEFLYRIICVHENTSLSSTLKSIKSTSNNIQNKSNAQQ